MLSCLICLCSPGAPPVPTESGEGQGRRISNSSFPGFGQGQSGEHSLALALPQGEWGKHLEEQRRQRSICFVFLSSLGIGSRASLWQCWPESTLLHTAVAILKCFTRRCGKGPQIYLQVEHSGVFKCLTAQLHCKGFQTSHLSLPFGGHCPVKKLNWELLHVKLQVVPSDPRIP